MDIDVDEVIIYRADDSYISRKNIQKHSNGKEIRKEHNIHRMLLAESFNWLKD